MAQTGFTPLQLYHSTTASAVPIAGNLQTGELAANVTDQKLYSKNGGGSVVKMAVSPAGDTMTGALEINRATSTSTTDYALHVKSSGGTPNAGRFLLSQGSTYGLAITPAVTSTTAARADFQWIDVATGALARAPMTIGYDGDVGIGSTAPGSQLEVLNANSTTYTPGATDAQAASGTTLALLNSNATLNTNISQIIFQSRSGAPWNRLVSSGGNTPFMAFGINNAERMRIDDAGNATIGTYAAGSFNRLTLTGDGATYFGGVEFKSGTSSAYITHDTAAGGGSFYVMNVDNAAMNIGTNNQVRMIVASTGGVQAVERLSAGSAAASAADKFLVTQGADFTLGTDYAFRVQGSGYVGGISLNATSMQIGQNSSTRSLTFHSGTGFTEALRIAGSNGLVSLQGTSGFSIARTAVTAPAAADGNVFSGTYTPTLTNTTNIAASTAAVCQYMRVGNVVTVSGSVTIDPTAAGRITMGMTIPVASNFASAIQAGGTFVATGVTTVNLGAISSDLTNDRFTFDGVVADIASRVYYFTASYQVI